MTIQEERRWREIEFYLFAKKILEAYNRNIIIYDLLNMFCALFNVNTTLIKALVKGVQTQESQLTPSRSELCVLGRKQGLSIRELRKITKIHPQTYYKIMKDESITNIHFENKLKDDSWFELDSFLTAIEKFGGLINE